MRYFSNWIVAFNSRPHKEVDPKTRSGTGAEKCFQLTTSQGGRQYPRQHFRDCLNLSTHDLTRRSTCVVEYLIFLDVFQLTTSQGGRPAHMHGNIGVTTFQLTTSQGGRQLFRQLTSGSTITFNSRPHKEVDEHVFPVKEFSNLSTHDLTRRSTFPGGASGYVWIAFQLTTSQGGRHSDNYAELLPDFFQLTTSQGGRLQAEML